MYCNLCPNNCNTDRDKLKGFCGCDNNVKIAKYYLHPFEEPVISGKNGSGTVFFCGCSLKCVFCQNYELSRNLRGKIISVSELANIFRKLEERGANNINLVNPTHYVDKIISAFNIYKPNIPVVYNSHGYEKIETLSKIDKYVDIYLPDLKFCSPAVSKRYCGKENYFAVAKESILFMANKKIEFFDNGIMKSGTIVRHLVLPQNVADSKNIIDFLATIKNKIYINLMSQYTPFGDIKNFPELQRKITAREYNTVLNYAIDLGFENMFFQKKESANETYIPNWDY